MRSADDGLLGIMGPVLRAEVGDTIRVVFKNKLSRDPVTLHPHGVAYLKGSEGAPYADGSSGARAAMPAGRYQVAAFVAAHRR